MLTAQYARIRVENAVARTSCPRCGADIEGAARACRACGFALLEAERRPLPRPPLRAVVLAAAAAGAVAAVVLVATLVTRESPPGPPPLPAPISAAEAARRLEVRLTSNSDDDTAAVRCALRLRYGTAIRCQVRYALGGVQPIVVRMLRDGSLEWDIPPLR
jgi:hypothetical protein